MDPKIEVVWGWESDEDMHSMQEAFASAGLDVETRRIAPAGNGVGFYLGVTVFEAGAGAFLVAFAGALGTAAGTDAWKGIKRVVGRLKEWFAQHYPSAPPHDRVTLNLRDAESGAMVYISSDLPDEAYQALGQLDPEPGTEYLWDEDAGLWEAQHYDAE
jgi:hypothetical protein